MTAPICVRNILEDYTFKSTRFDGAVAGGLGDFEADGAARREWWEAAGLSSF